MSEPKFDIAEFKKVGVIQQKQKEYFALRLHCIAGDLTSEQLQKVAEVSKKYGRGEIHISTRQGIEIHWIHFKDVEVAKGELASVGIAMGACGPRIRIVVGCPGNATCKWGIIETKEIARELDRVYFRQDTPHKFKLGVTGCPHNCAKATENDLGVMGALLPGWDGSSCIDCGLCVNVCPTRAITKVEDAGKYEYKLDEDKCINCSICTSGCPVNSWTPTVAGYNLSIGGTMGKIPRFGTILKKFIKDKEDLFALVEKAINYYRVNGRKKERFGHMIDRIGWERVKSEVLG